MKKALVLLVIALILCPVLSPLVSFVKAEDASTQTGEEIQAASASFAPEVICVPFHGERLGVPHDAWIGREITLKGTAHDKDGDATMVAYKWDFGDGYTTDWISGVNPYIIEAKHTYTGTMADGTPYGPGKYFTAWLYVKDNEGLVGKDSYFVAIREKTLEIEVNLALDNMLWWLHKQQIRGAYGDGTLYGYWYSPNGWHASFTGSSVEAFENMGHKPSGDLTEDPYVETVQRGLNYLFNQFHSYTISTQPAGDPDVNKNGIGLDCYTVSSHQVYETGIVLMTISSSGCPDMITTTGPTNVKGRAFKDIVQDMIDMCAYGQNDNGGWRYTWNRPDSDNSVTQWPVIGMEAAERNFGALVKVPDFVKTELWKWITASQCICHADPYYYGGFGYDAMHSWENVDKTGAGCAMIAFCDHPSTDTRYQAALSFLNYWWYSNNPSIWAWGGMNFGNPYAMYAIMKGLRLPPDLYGVGGVKFVSTHDWYAEYARYIVDHQTAHGGEWVDDHSWLSGYTGRILSTAWCALILMPTVVTPFPVADAGPDVPNHPPTIPVKFSGCGSYHRDPARKIVLYEWDFESDGTWDYSSATHTAEHAYPAYYNPDGSINWSETTKDYTVTLRVTDDSDLPLQATDTCVVHITPPPWKPVADPDGPYNGWKKFWIQLDGSKSYDPESKMYLPDHPWYETIVKYEWDLDNDGEFDDSTEIKPSWKWESKGTYSVGLKVTDSQPSGPGSTVGPLDVDIEYTTVVIKNHDPVADANGPYGGKSVKFDASRSYDPDGDKLYYRWDFTSDGTYDTDWLVDPFYEYTYPEPGKYAVTLQVYDGDGGYKAATAQVLPNYKEWLISVSDGLKQTSTSLIKSFAQLESRMQAITYKNLQFDEKRFLASLIVDLISTGTIGSPPSSLSDLKTLDFLNKLRTVLTGPTYGLKGVDLGLCLGSADDHIKESGAQTIDEIQSIYYQYIMGTMSEQRKFFPFNQGEETFLGLNSLLTDLDSDYSNFINTLCTYTIFETTSNLELINYIKNLNNQLQGAATNLRSVIYSKVTDNKEITVSYELGNLHFYKKQLDELVAKVAEITKIKDVILISKYASVGVKLINILALGTLTPVQLGVTLTYTAASVVSTFEETENVAVKSLIIANKFQGLIEMGSEIVQIKQLLEGTENYATWRVSFAYVHGEGTIRDLSTPNVVTWPGISGSQKGRIFAKNTGATSTWVIAHIYVYGPSTFTGDKFVAYFTAEPSEGLELQSNEEKEIEFEYTVLDTRAWTGCQRYEVEAYLSFGGKIVGPLTSYFYAGPECLCSRQIVLSGDVSQGQYKTTTVAVSDATVVSEFSLWYSGSDLDLHIYDKDGNHVGFNYATRQIDLEIPGATYSGSRSNPEWIRIPMHSGTTLQVTVVGVDIFGTESFLVTLTEIPEYQSLLASMPPTLFINRTETNTTDVILMEYGGQKDAINVNLTSSDLIRPEGGVIPSNNIVFSSNLFDIPASSFKSVNVSVAGIAGLPGGIYIGEINVACASGPSITIPISVFMPTLPMTIETWMSDSDFNNITDFRAVFTPYRNTKNYMLVATNPGQFYFNILVNNTSTETRNITLTYIIDPDFNLKGSQPIHVYADASRSVDISMSCTFSDNAITLYNVVPNSIIYITIHLDYALKATIWTKSQVDAWYSEHTFSATVDSITSATTITDPEAIIPSPVHFVLIVAILPAIALCLSILFALLKYLPLVVKRRE